MCWTNSPLNDGHRLDETTKCWMILLDRYAYGLHVIMLTNSSTQIYTLMVDAPMLDDMLDYLTSDCCTTMVD